MAISKADFKLSVDALNEYKRFHLTADGKVNPDDTHRLRLVGKKGKKHLECYDSKKSSDQEKISARDKIKGCFGYGNTSIENVNKFCKKELGQTLIEANLVIKTAEELKSDPNIKDIGYFAKLSFASRKKFVKLETIYQNRQQDNNSSFYNSIQKISSFVKELWRMSPFYNLTNEYNEFMLTQENLVDTGSFNFIHKDIFLDMIKDKEGPEFNSLRQGIAEMQCLEGNVIKGFFQSGRDAIAEKMFDQFSGLKNGENMWIDLSSCPGAHAMKGRIFWEEGEEGKVQYKFQMANTGAGIEYNADLHTEGYRDGKRSIKQW